MRRATVIARHSGASMISTLAWCTEFCWRRSRWPKWMTWFRMSSYWRSAAWQRCGRPEGLERGWQRSHANRANDYHRRSLPEDQLVDDTSEKDIGNCGDQESQGAAILDAIRNLPAAYKETLILRLVEGMTGPEIAARTGMTHGSVRVNLHRGIQQLRARLSSIPNSNGPQQETK